MLTCHSDESVCSHTHMHTQKHQRITGLTYSCWNALYIIHSCIDGDFIYGRVESKVSWLAACFIWSIVCLCNIVSQHFYCLHFLILTLKKNWCANCLSVCWSRLFLEHSHYSLNLCTSFWHARLASSLEVMVIPDHFNIVYNVSHTMEICYGNPCTSQIPNIRKKILYFIQVVIFSEVSISLNLTKYAHSLWT